MTRERTYLDHNATSPLRPEARTAMIDALDCAGNPSSVHAEGRRARAIVETAREQVAALVSARPADVVFTSGATEANNAVLRGPWSTVCYSPLEHPSVLGPLAAGDSARVEITVDGGGLVRPAAIEAALAPLPTRSATARGQTLLVLQAANNELGTVQPVAAAVEIAKRNGARVMCDAVQAAGRIPLNFEASGVDYMTLSAHKLGGPRGVGALIVRDGAPLPPFVLGGGQERRRRGGTENVAGIAGFGAAAAAARRDMGDMPRVAALRDRLETELRAMSPTVMVIGQDTDRLVNTSCFALPGTTAETVVIKLDLARIAVSAGAACSSGKVGASPMLTAIGLAPEIARAAIRISLGWSTSGSDVDAFLTIWARLFAGRSAERAVA